MSKSAISRQRSLECTPVRRRSGTNPEGEEIRFCEVYIHAYVTELSQCLCMIWRTFPLFSLAHGSHTCMV